MILISIVSSSQETMRWNPYKRFYYERPVHLSKAIRLISRLGSYTTGVEKIFTSLLGLKQKKWLFASKLIEKLKKQTNPLSFLATVRIRWETQERLQRSSLDSTWDLLQTKEDSAAYYYTYGLLYRDSLYEKIARKMGYVKASPDGVEFVDWRKMYTVHWEGPFKRFEQMHNYGDPYYPWKEKFADSTIIYFKKALAYDKSEFCYTKQLLLFMYSFGRREDIPPLINAVKQNYSPKAQKWLMKFLQWFSSPKKEILLEELALTNNFQCGPAE